MTSGLSLRGRRWVARTAQADVPLRADDRLIEALSQARQLRSDLRLSARECTDIDAYAARLWRAIEKKECIGIFGDYDCDGVTSTALLVRFLRRHGIEPVVRLPHRVHDGYGLRAQAVEFFRERGVTLLLTVDTGINSHEAIERAREYGIDTLIIDHHHPPAQWPAAVAIIHPSRMRTPPHDSPAAATLAFAVVDFLEEGSWTDREADLVLATLGTIADVMPLTAENRTLVTEGLAAIERLSTGPLSDVLAAAKPSRGQWTSTDLAFRIAPRINAAGRMDDPLVALRAVLDGGDAIEQLTKLNGERQEVLEQLLADLVATLGMEQASVSLPPLISATSAQYPHGLLGLLAGKMTERTGRPSMIGNVSDGIITASLRSPPCYHITQGLERVSEYLLHFGGHAQAAGCSLRAENMDTVRRLLEQDIATQCSAEDLCPTAYYDVTLLPSPVTVQLVRALQALEPFGPGNPEPRFILHNALLDSVRAVGSDGTHLQAKVGAIPIIGFGLAHLMEHTKQPLDLLVRLSENTWNERTTPQLMVEDMRISQ